MSGGGARHGIERDVTRLRRESIKDIQEDHLDAEVNRLLREILGEVNSRDTEQTRERLDSVVAALGEATEGVVDLLFGGSVARNTYVEGLSDVDALVIVEADSLGGASPSATLAAFAEVLQATHESVGVEVTTGSLAVTMRYPDGSELQLIPSVRDRDGVLTISNERGDGWLRIRPDRFARKLTKVNAERSGQVVPAIKLAKNLMARLPPQKQLSGYHIESLAIQAFDKYDGKRTLKDMLIHFFGSAKQGVLAPIRDSSQQSIHVDAYLGDANSIERRLAADSLGRLERKLRYATTTSQWKALFAS